MTGNRTYNIQTKNSEIPTGRVVFEVRDKSDFRKQKEYKDRPDEITITVPHRGGRRDVDEVSSIMVPLDALREFVHRNDETTPFNVKDGETVVALLKELVEETTDAPVIRTDHILYKELVGLGEKIIAVLLRELQDLNWASEVEAVWYCIAALHDITGETPSGNKADHREVKKMRDLWLKWGAEKGLAW